MTGLAVGHVAEIVRHIAFLCKHVNLRNEYVEYELSPRVEVAPHAIQRANLVIHRKQREESAERADDEVEHAVEREIGHVGVHKPEMASRLGNTTHLATGHVKHGIRRVQANYVYASPCDRYGHPAGTTPQLQNGAAKPPRRLDVERYVISDVRIDRVVHIGPLVVARPHELLALPHSLQGESHFLFKGYFAVRRE